MNLPGQLAGRPSRRERAVHCGPGKKAVASPSPSGLPSPQDICRTGQGLLCPGRWLLGGVPALLGPSRRVWGVGWGGQEQPALPPWLASCGPRGHNRSGGPRTETEDSSSLRGRPWQGHGGELAGSGGQPWPDLPSQGGAAARPCRAPHPPPKDPHTRPRHAVFRVLAAQRALRVAVEFAAERGQWQREKPSACSASPPHPCSGAWRGRCQGRLEPPPLPSWQPDPGWPGAQVGRRSLKRP